MKLSSSTFSRRAFTLIELMFAVSIGLVVAGSAVMLIYQSAKEQRRGLAAASVEASAYLLEARVSACLRGASATQGAIPLDYGATNAFGWNYAFKFDYLNTNGSYTHASISYTPSNGMVVYTPDLTAPATQQLWITNTATVRLVDFGFKTSNNLDGSLNSSLINVQFEMDDNGYQPQLKTNNLASILRSFSIQIRND